MSWLASCVSSLKESKGGWKGSFPKCSSRLRFGQPITSLLDLLQISPDSIVHMQAIVWTLQSLIHDFVFLCDETKNETRIKSGYE